jgi:hypothetical protein
MPRIKLRMNYYQKATDVKYGSGNRDFENY